MGRSFHQSPGGVRMRPPPPLWWVPCLTRALWSRVLRPLPPLQGWFVKYVVWSPDAAYVALLAKNAVVIADRNLKQICSVSESMAVRGVGAGASGAAARRCSFAAVVAVVVFLTAACFCGCGDRLL